MIETSSSFKVGMGGFLPGSRGDRGRTDAGRGRRTPVRSGSYDTPECYLWLSLNFSWQIFNQGAPRPRCAASENRPPPPRETPRFEAGNDGTRCAGRVVLFGDADPSGRQTRRP